MWFNLQNNTKDLGFQKQDGELTRTDERYIISLQLGCKFLKNKV